jgi:ABC-type glycerol-3-phosphate transport system substrate-binding protein
MASRTSNRRACPDHLARLRAALLCAAVVALSGCPKPADRPAKSDSAASLQGTSLRLLVVGDDAMAVAAEGLRGEWEGQTGSMLSIVRAAKLDAASLEPKPDAVVLPVELLPAAAASGGFAELPRPLIDDGDVGEVKAHTGDPPKARKAWTGVYSALKLRPARWGTKTVAVPLGSPTLVCYYRPDLLDRIGAKPPRTWADYRKAVEALSDRAKLGPAAPPEGKPWSGAYEPLGPGWAGWTLIARAAPYAAHRAHYSVLFHIDSMEPLIDGPPFVRALTELVEAAKFSPPDARQSDPAAARRAFWQGRCATALTWPTAADKSVDNAAEKSDLLKGEAPPVGVCELPGSVDVYTLDSKAWETRREGEDTRVTVLGMAGRVGVVPAGANSVSGGARLLLWLADDPWNRQIGPVSPQSTMIRTSDEKAARVWVEKPMSAKGATDYASVTHKNFMRSQVMLALRMPGWEECGCTSRSRQAVTPAGPRRGRRKVAGHPRSPRPRHAARRLSEGARAVATEARWFGLYGRNR